MKPCRLAIFAAALLAACGVDVGVSPVPSQATSAAEGSTSSTGTEGNTTTTGSDGSTMPTGPGTGPGGVSGTTGVTGPTAATGVDPHTLPKFSFFVTSVAALLRLADNDVGFGGDLRFGETGPGAGLRGADKICATIAETSMPGAGQKQWRAFLSATQGEDGKQVNAIDRVGPGPWFDRLGRTFALKKADLLSDRPVGAHAAIRNDFPNEDGVPNHAPDPTKGDVDNHDMLTGTDADGELYSATATCVDWTSSAGNVGLPRVGHSWPRAGSGVNWMSSLDEAGCAPGINLVEMGPPDYDVPTVGSGGGYGGFYCFALIP